MEVLKPEWEFVSVRKQISATRSREYRFRGAAIFLLVGVLACAEVRGRMDAYLSKPIRPQELDEVLARYGARQHVNA